MIFSLPKNDSTDFLVEHLEKDLSKLGQDYVPHCANTIQALNGLLFITDKRMIRTISNNYAIPDGFYSYDGLLKKGHIIENHKDDTHFFPKIKDTLLDGNGLFATSINIPLKCSLSKAKDTVIAIFLETIIALTGLTINITYVKDLPKYRNTLHTWQVKKNDYGVEGKHSELLHVVCGDCEMILAATYPQVIAGDDLVYLDKNLYGKRLTAHHLSVLKKQKGETACVY